MGLINIMVHAFRRVSHAEISLEKITIVAGPNESGKTSFAQAVGAALTGSTMPVDGILKKDAKALVNDASKKGFVRIENDGGNLAIEWPSLETKGEGETPPSADLVSAGLRNVFRLSDKDRAKYFGELLQIQVSKLAFRTSIGMHELPDDHFEALWKTCEQLGWDEAYSQVKEKGTKLKGRWEQVTGANYGAKLADGWQPDEWTFDLEKATQEGLEAEASQCREWVEAGITDTAVINTLSAMQVEELKKRAERKDEAENAYVTATNAHSAAKKAANDLQEKILNNKPQFASQPCPHCGKPLSVLGGKISVGTVTAEDATASQQVQQNLKLDLDKARNAQQDAFLAMTKAETAFGDAEDAVKKLAELSAEKPAKKSKTSIDLAKARANLARAEERLAAFKAKRDADEIFTLIEKNAVILAALAPDGLRLKRLTEVLDEVNPKLAELSKAAGYKTLAIQPDMSLKFGMHSYFLNSESMKYRANVILTLFVAGETGASCVVFDGADILDGRGRNGLLAAIKYTRKPALICMTMGAKEYERMKPALEENGTVKTYWMENGEI